MTAPQSKIFAIGDIHGCHQKLVTLLRRLPFDRQTDTLVFLGDYINRGPETDKVLDTLIELHETCANAVFLMGNHEYALLDYSYSGDPEALRVLRVMGIEATMESYKASLRRLPDLVCFPGAHREFLKSLKFCHLAGNHLFTHADITTAVLAAVRQGHPIAERELDTLPGLLSSRRLIREDICFTGSTIVFGHLPFLYPLVMRDRIGIDTGAVYGNVLTALELPALRFYHA